MSNNDRARDGEFRDPARQARHEQQRAATAAATGALGDVRRQQAAQGQAEVEQIRDRIVAAGGARSLTKRQAAAEWDALLRATRKAGAR